VDRTDDNAWKHRAGRIRHLASQCRFLSESGDRQRQDYGRQHGKDNPKGAHAGDLNNLTIPANGKLELQIDMPGIALRGEGGLLDEDGASLVIHANPDDYKTDPSGNSGARIACAPISIPDREE